MAPCTPCCPVPAVADGRADISRHGHSTTLPRPVAAGSDGSTSEDARFTATAGAQSFETCIVQGGSGALPGVDTNGVVDVNDVLIVLAAWT